MHHILIVDDNAGERFVARCTLEDALGGGKIKECPDGDEALTFLAATRPAPQIVLLDVNMPGMTGPEVLRRIASDTVMARRLKDTTFFLFSNWGHDDLSAGELALRVQFVSKPILTEDVALMAQSLEKSPDERHAP